MAWSKARIAAFGLAVVGLGAVSLVEHRAQVRLADENQSLRQQAESLQSDNNRLSGLLAKASRAPVAQARPSPELLRLRGEAGILRWQTNELNRLLAKPDNVEPQPPPAASPQDQPPLPVDYPKTIGDAAKGMVEALSGGELEKFYTNFVPPDVSREKADKMFGLYYRNELGGNTLAGLELVGIGEPTNSYYGMNLGPNKWFIPCTTRLPDGAEEANEMLIGRDPKTQKWYFLGGLKH
jgi:hypothetical protein